MVNVADGVARASPEATTVNVADSPAVTLAGSIRPVVPGGRPVTDRLMLSATAKAVVTI